MSRCFLLFSCALLLACDAEPLRKAVVVTPQLAADVAAQLTTLEARVALDGVEAQQGAQSFGPTERPFTLLLPAGAKGVVQVQVTALAGVALARGHGELTLDERTEYALTVPVQRPLLARPALKIPFVRQVLLGDLNEDKKLDLLVARSDQTSLQVLLGKGDGTFEPLVNTMATNSDIRDMALKDVDGDGHLDLALAHGANRTASLWWGVGDGTFAGPSTQETEIASSVALGDLNGDGRPDLAVASVVNGGVALFLQGAERRISPGSVVDLQGSYDSVAIADLSGDGKADLVMARSRVTGGGVFVARGLGGGRFEDPKAFTATPGGPQRARVADLNGDKKLDVVASSLGKPNLSVLLGTGDGALGAAANLSSGESSFDLSIDDFDGDGVPDVLAPLFGSDPMAMTPGGVSLLLGVGDGTFEAPFVVSTAPQPASIAVGDINGDGLLDVLTNHETPGEIGVFVHSGAAF